jgi:hypothetical protein
VGVKRDWAKTGREWIRIEAESKRAVARLIREASDQGGKVSNVRLSVVSKGEIRIDRKVNCPGPCSSRI